MEKQAALDLLEFIHESPTNFHAVLSIKQRLQAHGFKQLFSGEAWHIEHGGKYFVTKNHSSLYAFIPGNGNLAEEGFKLICAHSDSPTFRIKPHAEMPVEGKYLKLNTEVYGGPIMYTWFDRPLSMAGRVMVKSDKPLKPATQFINFDRPLLEIPHIAIHFNRAVNDQGNPLSKQRDMLPVIAMINETFEKDNFLLKLIAQEMNIPAEDILDFDLTLYEYGKGTLFGLNNEFISSGRLDDLAMVHAGLTALLDSKPCNKTKVLAIFDNEEVGSLSKQGADSTLLGDVLTRALCALGLSDAQIRAALAASFMVSADNAHAVHPNHPEKYDDLNRTVMNGGVVIKHNANQKYTTDAVSDAIFSEICAKAGVPVQHFANRSDIPGGSTLGNLSNAHVSMNTVDIGLAQLAMHASYETAGCADVDYMIRALRQFYKTDIITSADGEYQLV